MTTKDEMNGATEEAAAALENPLQQERDELQDRLLRTVAEFDNYRKRTDRERRELSDYITTDILRELLPIVDDLERALAAPANLTDNPEFAAFHQGVTLIHRHWLEV